MSKRLLPLVSTGPSVLQVQSKPTSFIIVTCLRRPGNVQVILGLLWAGGRSAPGSLAGDPNVSPEFPPLRVGARWLIALSPFFGSPELRVFRPSSRWQAGCAAVIRQ
jgi:hypothetical protein